MVAWSINGNFELQNYSQEGKLCLAVFSSKIHENSARNDKSCQKLCEHNLSKPSRGWETFAVWYLQGTKKAMLESKGGAPAGTRQAKEITTETSRPRIERYAWQLILAPDVNDSRHVALLSNQKGELTWLHSWAFGCQVKCIMVVQPRSSIGLCPGCHSRGPKLLS